MKKNSITNLKQLLVTLLLSAVTFVSLCGTSFAAGSIDVVHQRTSGFGFGNSVDEMKRFQTFVAADSTQLKSIQLKLRRFNGTAQSDVTVELYAVSNNKPAGSSLASTTISSYYITSDFQMCYANLSYNYLTPGQKYAIVLSQSTLQAARYEWAVSDVSSNLNFGKWNGSTWIDESGLGDAWMKIFTNKPENIIDITHSGPWGNSFGNSVDEIKRFQTFLSTDSSGTLSGVDLKLRKDSGFGHSDITVELYQTYNNLPSGLPLTTASIPASSVATAWTVVHAPLKYTGLLSNVKYAIVLSQRNLQSATYEWNVGHTDNGLEFGKWNGTAWVNESGLGDGWMKVYLGRYSRISDITHVRQLGNGFGNNTDELKRYQTFSLYSGYNPTNKIAGIDLKIRKYNGTSQSDVVVELYATSNNIPTGAPLSTAIIPAFSVGADWTIVHAPLKYNFIQDGALYAIVLSQRTSQPSRYEWAVGHVNSSLEFGKYNGYTYVNESGLGDGWMKIWWDKSEQITDITHPRLLGNGFGNYTDEIKRYQTFATPYSSYRYVINGIDLKLRKVVGNTQSDIIVELYATDNSVPVGSPLSRTIIPAYAVGSDWTIVNAPVYYGNMVAGKEYAVVLTQRSTQSARYEWAAGDVDSNLDFGKFNGYTWVNESGLGDGWMKVWSYPIVIN